MLVANCKINKHKYMHISTNKLIHDAAMHFVRYKKITQYQSHRASVEVGMSFAIPRLYKTIFWRHQPWAMRSIS